MSLKVILSAAEARVIGCLIEKQITTPDQYPLSLNAIVNGASQKTNRDPVLTMSEEQASEAVEGLRGKGVLYLKEDPDHRFVFQLVGKRWSVKRDAAWGAASPRTRLVLLGLPGSLDDARLIADFSALGSPG